MKDVDTWVCKRRDYVHGVGEAPARIAKKRLESISLASKESVDYKTVARTLTFSIPLSNSLQDVSNLVVWLWKKVWFNHTYFCGLLRAHGLNLKDKQGYLKLQSCHMQHMAYVKQFWTNTSSTYHGIWGPYFRTHCYGMLTRKKVWLTCLLQTFASHKPLPLTIIGAAVYCIKEKKP